MEKKIGGLDRKSVVSVLTQGMELANELKKQLDPRPPCSREICDSILEKIVFSYEKALNLLGYMALLPNAGLTCSSSHISLSTRSTSMLGSPNSIHEFSPRSSTAGSDPDSKDQIVKKRKRMPEWSEQVRVCTETGTGFEGQLDDGYHWRKYGQKDILGSIHPRAYYRCTHRNTQGCLATKQVQRADDDSSMYVVVYKGNHTCIHERINKPKKENSMAPIPKKLEEVGDSQQQSSQKMIITSVKTEEETRQDLNKDAKEDHFSCFSIPNPTSVDGHVYQTQTAHSFPEPEPEPEPEPASSIFVELLSQATSESCFSQCQGFPTNQFAFEDSDLAEILSVPITSATSNVVQLEELDTLDKESFDTHHLLEAIDFFQQQSHMNVIL